MSLSLVAWISIGVAFACALVIAADEFRRPQQMGVMNIVWPVSGLYFSVFAVWAYFRVGVRHSRQAAEEHANASSPSGSNSAMKTKDQPPTLTQVAVGTSHCGAGCMIADVGTDFAIAASGLVLFGATLWTEYTLDFIVAWALGIVFQYFAIKPMRPGLSVGGAIWAAMKADTLSILAFQIGMYAFMALVYFKFFPAPHHLTPFDPRYWLMMQAAMICGFCTSFPMNRLLIGVGLKEKM